MNPIQQQDIEQFAKIFALAESLQNSTFLITGATGLIGSNLIHCLLALDNNIRIIAPVRNKAKTKTILEKSADKIEVIECDIADYDYTQLGNIDYIIHCAAPTASRYFVDYPVETFEVIISVTQKLLEYAKSSKVKSFVYLSSLEVYGEIHEDTKFIHEDFQGYINPLCVRSSYPMAKRAAENLCCLYCSEYCVPAKIARLTQTTGAGIALDDNRVIAQFARRTAKGQDIILHTTGESARPYCYTMDCISAILYILIKGTSGEAYNVANEGTYISARDMAYYLKNNFNTQIDVKLELNENFGYAPVTKLKLSTSKLMSLGWKPYYGIYDIMYNLIQYLR